MRIIARKSLIEFWKNHADSEIPLKVWFSEVKKATWKNHQELKSQLRNASIISNKRVIFNIKGNNYRLIADIEYHLKIVFVVWIGTHNNYNKINAKKIKYDKANKK